MNQYQLQHQLQHTHQYQLQLMDILAWTLLVLSVRLAENPFGGKAIAVSKDPFQSMWLDSCGAAFAVL